MGLDVPWFQLIAQTTKISMSPSWHQSPHMSKRSQVIALISSGPFMVTWVLDIDTTQLKQDHGFRHGTQLQPRTKCHHRHIWHYRPLSSIWPSIWLPDINMVWGSIPDHWHPDGFQWQHWPQTSVQSLTGVVPWRPWGPAQYIISPWPQVVVKAPLICLLLTIIMFPVLPLSVAHELLDIAFSSISPICIPLFQFLHHIYAYHRGTPYGGCCRFSGVSVSVTVQLLQGLFCWGSGKLVM